jgi:hypothetical protein
MCEALGLILRTAKNKNKNKTKTSKELEIESGELFKCQVRVSLRDRVGQMFK